MKIMIIVGTRPELIKLSRIIDTIEKYQKLVLVHTGQNYDYELNEIFFKDLNIRKPDYYLQVVGNSLGSTIGNIISKSDDIFKKEMPDAVLVLGDTNSALSTIAAKRRKIPIFHYEAGNRCFDMRVPEEINRKIVDHIADINLTYSDVAKSNLQNEGLSIDRIFNIGSPMFEVLNCYSDKIQQSDVVVNLDLKKHQYFVLSAHREETVDDVNQLRKLIVSINEMAKHYDMDVLFSVHPRTEARLKKSKLKLNKRIRILKPLGFTDYISLQVNSFCVVSDSGTITEESSILGFPAVNIRETHERQEGVEKGAVPMSGLSSQNLIDCIEVSTNPRYCLENSERVGDYHQRNTSMKVLKIILSYTHYINKYTWGKIQEDI